MDSDFSDEEKKKAVFEAMSPRRQKYIRDKVGYETWNPFEKPKDPIDIRQDRTKRTSQTLIREFLQGLDSDNYSNEYSRGAFEICLGIINKNEKYEGMFDFACWHAELLKEEGFEKK